VRLTDFDGLIKGDVFERVKKDFLRQVDGETLHYLKVKSSLAHAVRYNEAMLVPREVYEQEMFDSRGLGYTTSPEGAGE